ncbi:hypothetical protein ACQ4PT_001528 [Festuca glaucescens]
MASGSHCSSSSMSRKQYRVPTRELPIVKCNKCNLRDMVQFTAHTHVNGNQNRDFFKCPNHKPKGCNFWKWSDEYEDFLVASGLLPPLNDNVKMQQSNPVRMLKQSSSNAKTERQGRTQFDDAKLCMLFVALFDVGKEILGVLKLICACLGLVLVVLIISIFVRQ